LELHWSGSHFGVGVESGAQQDVGHDRQSIYDVYPFCGYCGQCTNLWGKPACHVCSERTPHCLWRGVVIGQIRAKSASQNIKTALESAMLCEQ